MIIKTTYAKSLIALFVCGTLSACGGGGADSTNTNNGGNTTLPPSTETLTFSLDANSLSLDEATTAEVALSASYSGGSNIAYAVEVIEGEADLVNFNVNQNTLVISAGDVDSDADFKLSITASVGSLADSEELTIHVVNTSVAAVIAEASIWTDGSQVFKFDDLEQVAPLYVQAAYLAGAISRNERQNLIDGFNNTLSTARSAAQQDEAKQLATAINNYQQSSITESQLIEALSQHKAFVQAQSDSILSALKVIAELSPDLPVIQLAPYQYIEQYDAFSAVIGNSSLGSFQDGKWVFSGQYHFLNQHVPALGTQSSCDAE